MVTIGRLKNLRLLSCEILPWKYGDFVIENDNSVLLNKNKISTDFNLKRGKSKRVAVTSWR